MAQAEPTICGRFVERLKLKVATEREAHLRLICPHGLICPYGLCLMSDRAKDDVPPQSEFIDHSLSWKPKLLKLLAWLDRSLFFVRFGK